MATIDNPDALAAQLLQLDAQRRADEEQAIQARISAAQAEKGSELTMVEKARAAFGRDWRG
jgi:hypothetical protein